MNKKGEFMSKYLVIAAALVVLAVACNKKEETAPVESAPIEETTPAADEASAVEEAPADEAHTHEEQAE